MEDNYRLAYTGTQIDAILGKANTVPWEDVFEYTNKIGIAKIGNTIIS